MTSKKKSCFPLKQKHFFIFFKKKQSFFHFIIKIHYFCNRFKTKNHKTLFYIRGTTVFKTIIKHKTI